jgi:Ca2+-binding EF-hand superfamily protein
MLNQYDQNKNGVLEREEWSKMRNEPEKGDKDGDGKITLDELTERLGGWRAQRASGDSASNSSTTSGPGASGFGGGDFGGGRGGFGGRGSFGRRSFEPLRPTTGSGGQPYRFLTPAERMPEGLPSEFTTKDRDGDGQLSMAEFSTTWNESTLSSFNRWDLNGDGFVTAAECLAAENRSASAR